ncbi:MAG: flagella basal body P-ring formation protein FlgA [SAR86 cluster bacterium]|uniref:Flagella basal body P-ring formation protein FlgA n=1 Tax=SAR86 cluster bacterium TaxID=2030880 RepID=A0A2A4XGM5_9GAMM|nr:MAG: flagella basal body P-ring formation protein FlgA [SAR86 cluster bacterium]
MNVTLLTDKKTPTAMNPFSVTSNYYLGLLGLLLCLCGIPNSYAEEVESLDSIRLIAEDHALAQIDHSQFEDAVATAGSLDTRLQLKKCNIPLETFSTGTMNNTSRMTVGVRCSGLNPWTLYVPVTISALVNVVFTSRALTRGALLDAEDLEVQQVPLNKLPIGYLSDPSQVTNFELIRPLNVGAPITLSAVRPRNIVRQGQEVIIKAQIAGLQVRMTGQALKNGQSGDLIPVRNLRSGRTIEATILNKSTVSVNL